MKKQLLKGFTLIELLIVIAIIGILAVALLPSVLGAPARARDAARKADIGNIIAALESYNSDNQSYPAQKLCLGDGNTDKLIKDYFQGGKVPKDPQGSSAKQIVGGCAKGEYLYCSAKSPNNYFVAAAMEIKGDANVAATKVLCPGAVDNVPPDLTLPGNVPTDSDASYVISK